MGNVSKIQVVSDKNHQLTPVEVTMKVSTRYHYNLHKDSSTLLSTAGVLGETYIDIDSSVAKGPEAEDGDILPSREVADFQDVVRASQGTLQNLDALNQAPGQGVIGFVESGNGSVGKLIYDPTLYNKLASTVNEFQGLMNQVSQGKGTLGQAGF